MTNRGRVYQALDLLRHVDKQDLDPATTRLLNTAFKALEQAYRLMVGADAN